MQELIKNNLEQKSIIVQDIEAIKAEYLNKDYIHEPVYFNYRINNRGKRYYARLFENGEIITAPSFSAISDTVSPIPYNLLDWYVRNGWDYCNSFKEHSANYGTYFHYLCGRILRGDKILTTESFILLDMQKFFYKEELDYDGCVKWMRQEKRDLRKDLYGFCRWCQDYKVVPIAIEYPVMEETGLWAGTIDLVCKIYISKNLWLIAIVDFKSGMNGFYENHEIQLHAYKPLWDREYPELPIERVYNYGCHDYRIPLSKKVTPYKFKDQTDSKHAYKWGHWVAIYHVDPDNKIIESRTDFALDKELSMEADLEDMFETVNPIEFLKNQEAF